MSFDEKAFSYLELLTRRVEVVVGNNATIRAIGVGTVPLDTPGGLVYLHNMLLVPDLAANLISYT